MNAPRGPLPTPDLLSDQEAVRLWFHVKHAASAHAQLLPIDAIMLEAAVRYIQLVRRGHRELATVRCAYRMLGRFLLTMPERRALLFPERPKRRDP